jgi:hypothetical protein
MQPLQVSPLQVSQLPFVRSEGNTHSVMMEQDGFVDEAVVNAMVSKPMGRRSMAKPSDMVLSAEELDFAGWDFPVAAVERVPKPVAVPVAMIVRPVEADKVAPLKLSRAREQHPENTGRWWLAGLLGVIATIVFSLVLLKIIAPAAFKVTPPVVEEVAPPQNAEITFPQRPK